MEYYIFSCFIKVRKKQYVILQVHFEKIWQFEFGKITVSKRIKRTKITLSCGLFNLK